MENPQLIAHKSYVFFQLYFGYVVSDAKAKPASIQIRIVNLTGNYEWSIECKWSKHQFHIFQMLYINEFL